MFVNFPTGFGKSLIYQALPLIQCRYNSQRILAICCCGGFAACESYEEQVIQLRSLGISLVSLSNIEEN